ncbi:MAG: GGDEF domain-containing protein [Lachnospiraceae bacterium]|nr:GGDEF domain-containing protein [Lachnospiraceae bacterium]
MVLVFIIYIIMKSIAILQEAAVLTLPKFLYSIVCFLVLLLLMVYAYSLYSYAVFHFDIMAVKRSMALKIGAIPMFTLAILLVVSVFTGWIYSISDEGVMVYGPGRFILFLLSGSYFLAIIITSIRKAVENRMSSQRHEAVMTIIGLILLYLFILLDIRQDHASIIPMAVFTVNFILFTNLLGSKVYSDALTGLNNRRKAEDYFTSQQDFISEEVPLYLMTGDINYFKEINDTYGHQEGDEALILAAREIRNIAVRYNGLASRFGGDEFTVAFRRSKESRTNVQEIAEELNQSLAKACKDKNKPYCLTFSIGYSICTDPTVSIDEYLREADEMLYREKRLFHSKKE